MNHGCVVDGCDTAARARGWCSRHYQRWQRTGDPTGTIPRGSRCDAWQHGSRRGYQTGCRCFPCRVANNRYQRAHRQGHTVRIPIDQVLAHLDQLTRSGWTLAAITDAADLGNSTLYQLRSGRQQTVNPRTAGAILDLEPYRGPERLPAGPLVDAIRTRQGHRRLTELLPNVEDRRAFYRAADSGTVTEPIADRLAIRALGLTIEAIYGWQAVAS